MENVSYEQVVALVDRLSPVEQTRLTTYLLEAAQKRQLSAEEKMRLLRSIQFDVEVNETASVRRVDWYDDDGR
jgi:hypothetical protein